jgi:hypothetical protein
MIVLSLALMFGIMIFGANPSEARGYGSHSVSHRGHYHINRGVGK